MTCNAVFIHSGLDMLAHNDVTLETLAQHYPETFSDLIADKVVCQRLTIIGN